MVRRVCFSMRLPTGLSSRDAEVQRESGISVYRLLAVADSRLYDDVFAHTYLYIVPFLAFSLVEEGISTRIQPHHTANIIAIVSNSWGLAVGIITTIYLVKASN